MATIKSGSGSDLLTVDPTQKAARVITRSGNHWGQFRCSMKTGNITASQAAGSMMAAFRFTGGTNMFYCGITSIKVAINGITGYTAGGVVLGLWLTKNYSVTETTAYTAASFSGNKQKLRTVLAASESAFGVVTTTTISGGTGTDDAAPIAALTYNLPATITNQPAQDFLNLNLQSHPIILDINEGFRIRNDTVFPATGSCNLVISIEWFESLYPF